MVERMFNMSLTTRAWFRVINDGTTLKVLAQQSATKPSDSSWSDSSHKIYESTHYPSLGLGGQIGFTGGHDTIYIDSLTLKSDTNADGTQAMRFAHLSIVARACSILGFSAPGKWVAPRRLRRASDGC